MDKEYILADADVSTLACACPCCGATPELYEIHNPVTPNVLKLVVCSTNSLALSDDPSSDLSCPLFSQSAEIELELAGATYKEAVKNWNQYVSLLEMAKSKNAAKIKPAV